MTRLTEEQRAVCAEHVPLARRLAAGYSARRNLDAQSAEDVEATFLLALPIVVAEYDPTRGTTMRTHVIDRLAHRALDIMRKENGRPGKLSNRMRAATVSLDYCLGTDFDSGRSLMIGDTVPDARAARPSAEVELFDALAVCRRHVTSRELYLVVQTYLVGRTLAEVGADFGFSEGRACNLRSGAVRKLLAAGALEGQ